MISIKKAIAEAPALMSPNFDDEFILYTFSFDISYAEVFNQNRHEGVEVLISFMISRLQAVELNCIK